MISSLMAEKVDALSIAQQVIREIEPDEAEPNQAEPVEKALASDAFRFVCDIVVAFQHRSFNEPDNPSLSLNDQSGVRWVSQNGNLYDHGSRLSADEPEFFKFGASGIRRSRKCYVLSLQDSWKGEPNVLALTHSVGGLISSFATSSDEAATLSEPQKSLQKTIGLLDPVDRKLLEMTLTGSLTRREIGLLIGMSSGTVTRRVRRILKRLYDPAVTALVNRGMFLPELHQDVGLAFWLRRRSLSQISEEFGLSRHAVKAMLKYIRGWLRHTSTAVAHVVATPSNPTKIPLTKPHSKP
jgi:DNA-directed RNA polymerase specialized sigma24 family protein